MNNRYLPEAWRDNSHNKMLAAYAAHLPRDASVLGISLPDDGKLRVRKPVSRANARSSMKYPSLKMRRMIQCESLAELNVIRLLDANPAVLSFAEQPLTIAFQLNGEIHRHVPDVLVRTTDGKELWEIKDDYGSVTPEIVQRTELLIRDLPAFGYRYRLVIAKSVAKEVRMANIVELLRFGRSPVSALDREKLRILFSRQRTLRWGDVVDGKREVHKQVCRLILEGVVRLDVTQPITASSALTWVPGTQFIGRENHYGRI